MKRCPTCDKTFDDSMRFCQSDGTPLVDDAPVDPYKTMVARPEDIAAATSGASDDLLDLPKESDPAKTMYASEDEIRAEMNKFDARDEQVIDIPPLTEPRFSDPAPPPSPFSSPEPSTPSVAPIPSPFDSPKPKGYDPPETSFADPEPFRDEPAAFNPFDQPAGGAMAQADWTPPPAPDSGWQNQEIGQNTPFQPPVVGGGDQNQTLAIISLVLGILSIFCCGWIIPGVAAVVLGYIAKSKAETDPANYGGRGLALGGMITGGISLALGIVVIILYVFTGLLSSVI